MADDVRAHVIFRLGAERYALDAARVERVLQDRATTPLPAGPAHLLGLVREHDDWIPVVDPAPALGAPAAGPDGRGTLIVLRRGPVRYALAVDAVDAARAVALEEGPEGGALVREHDGVASVLDPDELFTTDPPPEAAAGRADAASAHAAAIRLVAVRVAAVEGALPVTRVREVLPYAAPRPLRDAPDFVLGSVAVRAESLPVLDLRVLLGVATAPAGDDTRLVRADLAGRDVALLVDAVSDVVTAATEQLREPPRFLRAWGGEPVQAIVDLGERLLVLLRLEALLDDERAEVLAGLDATAHGS